MDFPLASAIDFLRVLDSGKSNAQRNENEKKQHITIRKYDRQTLAYRTLKWRLVEVGEEGRVRPLQ